MQAVVHLGPTHLLRRLTRLSHPYTAPETSQLHQPISMLPLVNKPTLLPHGQAHMALDRYQVPRHGLPRPIKRP